jgi:DNA primase
VDIVDVISQVVDLEERNGEFWGISPFTDPPERTPSFSVRRESGTFYDFSSGIGGNTYTFLRYYYHYSRQEAIAKLKTLAHVTDDGVHMIIKPSMAETVRIFRPPQQHRKESKMTMLAPDYMDRFENRPEKLEIWRNEGIPDEVMERFSVRYDPFSNRIVYPIRDPDGTIVNVGGRTLDTDWKEKGEKKYCYFFPWGRMQTVYGLAENKDTIKEAGAVILFEGCKSVLKAASWGIENTGAILTSHLNPDQTRILVRLGCDVVFALDKGVDIRKDHNIQQLKQFVNVFYLWDRDGLLDDKDSPVDKGEEVFRTLCESRLRYR